MNITSFTNKFIEKKYLTSNPQEDNGFDYESDDDYTLLFFEKLVM